MQGAVRGLPCLPPSTCVEYYSTCGVLEYSREGRAASLACLRVLVEHVDGLDERRLRVERARTQPQRVPVREDLLLREARAADDLVTGLGASGGVIDADVVL